MSRANITPPAPRQDDRDDDGLDIPEFLKICAERRKQAWREFDARRPSKPTPTIGRELSETERAYWASIEREKAARRAADEVRFKVMRAKAAAEKVERRAVEQAVQQQKREERRAPRALNSPIPGGTAAAWPAADKRRARRLRRRALRNRPNEELQMLQYVNGHRRAISGAGLAQLRRRMTPAERACLAADIVDGRVILQGLTTKAVAALVGVSVGYVDHALRLTPEQREQVRHGDRPLVSPRTYPPSDGGCMSDDMLVEVVRRVGIDRALHAMVVAEDTAA